MNLFQEAVGLETTRVELPNELKAVNDPVLRHKKSLTSIIEEFKELK